MLINILLIILIIISETIISYYNRFIKKRNRVLERESQIDVLMKQRFDLIPNIVECVKGYTKYELSTLKELTELRSSYKENGFSIEEAEKADKKFNNIMILSEAYLELKANTQFLKLHDNLSEIEDELSDARTSYNYAVTTYNNLVESVPSNIIAKIFAFSKKKLFEIEDKEKENNKLEF